MAHFTEDQAKACKLQSSNKEFTDGDFAYWVLRASGSDGQYHQFVDHDLAVNATAAKIKTKLIGHLTGSAVFYTAPVELVISGSVHYAGSYGDDLG
jgi:hypothetical protein